METEKGTRKCALIFYGHGNRIVADLGEVNLEKVEIDAEPNQSSITIQTKTIKWHIYGRKNIKKFREKWG